MKQTYILTFIYLYFQAIHCLPSGLVENSNIVFNAVPATPRFPGLRPKPEATTFIPLRGNDTNEAESNKSGEENGSGQEDSSQDVINYRHNVPTHSPCRTKFETIYEIEEVETEEEKCTTVNERKCETTFVNKCVPYIENQCQIIPRNKCKTEFRQECRKLFRDEEQSYVEDKCETKTIKKCEKYWKVISNNRKVWEENPDKCQDILQTNCSPVTKVKINRVPYDECIKVPFEKCIQIDENVCSDIPKEKCNLEPKEECRNIPKQECRILHLLVPKQIARQIQIRVCDDHKNEEDDTNTEYEDDYDYELDTRKPSIPVQPTEQPPVRLFNSNQGQKDLSEILLTGQCLSWNGKTCTDEDRVDVGRGPGSCDSNVDCPCCAPFCSKSGYCQTTISLATSESCPNIPNSPKDCDRNTKSTCWSPGVHDIDCPEHGLCCFDGCSNTCYKGNNTQQQGIFESNVVPLLNPSNETPRPSGEQHEYPLMDDIIDTRPDIFPCTCIEYTNKNGVGNCTKSGRDNRFIDQNVCYVALPSSCPDLKNSRTDAGKFLSAVACQGSNKKDNVTNSITKTKHY